MTVDKNKIPEERAQFVARANEYKNQRFAGIEAAKGAKAREFVDEICHMLSAGLALMALADDRDPQGVAIFLDILTSTHSSHSQLARRVYLGENAEVDYTFELMEYAKETVEGAHDILAGR